MRSIAAKWIDGHKDTARLMLNTFISKDINVDTQVIRHLSRQGYIRRVARLPGDRGQWIATDRLRNRIEPKRKPIFSPPEWWDQEDEYDE